MHNVLSKYITSILHGCIQHMADVMFGQNTTLSGEKIVRYDIWLKLSTQFFVHKLLKQSIDPVTI